MASLCLSILANIASSTDILAVSTSGASSFSNDFSVSLNFNLSGEEHATLTGLPLSRRSTKDLISDYNLKMENLNSLDDEIEDEIVEDIDTSTNDGDDHKPSGQMTLF